MEDVHFLRKQKNFHNNHGINPETGKRLIEGKGPWLKFVALYGLPVKTEIVKISLPLETLPFDLLEEIMKHLDSYSKVSFLLINKSLNCLAGKYKDDVIKYALERELKYTKETYKLYRKNTTLDIKIGDRLTDGFNNFKVMTIKGMKGKLVLVDMFGNKINDEPYDLCMEKDINHKFYHWHVKTPKNVEINYGILQYTCGPKIESLDSHYLKYKTVAFNAIALEPTVNVMVLVKKKSGRIFDDKAEYYITEMNDHYLMLKFVNSYVKDFVDTIKVYKIKEDYVLDQVGYKIKKFGGFLS